MNGRRRNRSIALLALLSLVGFFLRLMLIDAQSIWWDEAISIHLATSSVRDLLANRAAHVHPPLYFLLLKGWGALVGSSAFSVRFLSAAWNVLLIPAVYVFSRRWIGRRTGLVVAALVSLSPLYIIYSQEARVYALLPLCYLGLLALMERLSRQPTSRWREWLLLAAVEAVGLLLHYVFLFPVIYVNLLLLLRLRRRRRFLRRWLVSAGLVVLFCLPWVVAVVLNWQAVLSDARADMPFVERVPLDHFARLLWTFQWSGHTRALVDSPLLTVGLVIAALLAAAVVWLLWARETRTPLLRLFAHWLVPLSGALLMWQAKPLSHPRYVALFTVALFLICAYVIVRLTERRGTILAALLGLAILANSFISLRAYYFDPDFAKDDARGVAEMIAAQANAGDLVLVPPEDWSIPYYYDGPAQIDMSWAGDAPADWQRLANLTAGADQVFLVDYNRATRDPRHIYPFALEGAGRLVERREFKGLFVRTYRVDRAVSPPSLEPVDARFGPLQLTGAWLEQGAPADTAVTVALRWRLVRPEALGSDPSRVGLRLRDADGWRWTSTDDWLLDGTAQPTGDWVAEQEATTYHVLPLPPGTPPLTYHLSLGVYQVVDENTRSLDLLDSSSAPQGQSLDLGRVALDAALGLEADPYDMADTVPVWGTSRELGEDLVVVGASLDRDQVAPGQALFATVHWRAEVQTAPMTATLALQQGGADLARVVDPVGGRYPVDRWREGQAVVEHRRLVVPPGAETGPATVVLRVGEQEIEIDQVMVAAEAHVFEPPPMEHELGVRFGDVAELLGYDLAQTEVTSNQPVTLTLYWRALEGASVANYTVFTHILAADGHLVGQHDGPPAQGKRPTPGWVVDEIVVDRHPMAFREEYAGPARIEVGLYDPVTLDRVPTADGADHLILPTPLDVIQRRSLLN